MNKDEAASQVDQSIARKATLHDEFADISNLISKR